MFNYSIYIVCSPTVYIFSMLAFSSVCVQNAGSLHPIIVTKERNCADAKSSVIATKAECQKAAIMAGLSRTDTHGMPYIAYCGFNKALNSYSFDTTGKTNGIITCNHQKHFDCVCKKGVYACQTICKHIVYLSVLLVINHIHRHFLLENHMYCPFLLEQIQSTRESNACTASVTGRQCGNLTSTS